jgi:dipeptidyl aminopeptidase/acylaminoacyl peptidase
MSRVAPFGAWPTPVTAELATRGALRLSQPRLDGDDLYWVEGRPQEGGRQRVVRSAPGRAPEDVTPESVNVRSGVHEYGGGDFAVRDGALVFADFGEGGAWLAERGGAPRRLPGAVPGRRYADFALAPDGRSLVCVEEELRAGGEPANRLVALSRHDGARQVVADGFDFVSFPRFAPDGRQLAFTAWNHPNLPWDGTSLWLVAWGENGPAAAPRRVAGGERESIFQPGFSPDGVLTFVSDRSGYWNLYQLRDGGTVPLCPHASEFGRPQWVFGMSSYAFADARTIVCVHGRGGEDRLALLDVATGGLRDLPLPFVAVDAVDAGRGRVACIAASPTRAAAVVAFRLGDAGVREERASSALELDPSALSCAEAIEVATPDGETTHAFYYAPRNPACGGPTGQRPPLRVVSHGGPTACSSPGLHVGVQYWTQRGFAVADVNYRGSTGFGRAYRDRLRGAWGVVDVEDCEAVARELARDGRVDAGRLAISGSSAGGYTTLCALTFGDAVAAGASHYGVGDLEALARDTHKFESRYLDALIGPYPERRDLYLARSPLHHAERLERPVIFFQGLEDRVVPPSQAETLVAALAARGVPHAYVSFAGEGHGFRRAESLRTALDGEWWFYGRVFGFDTGPAPPGVELRGALRRGPA